MHRDLTLEELSYLYGLFLTDGSMRFRKQQTRRDFFRSFN